MRVETRSEQLLFSTVRLQTNLGVGTGFIVGHQWAVDKHGLFLVTNKHVIAGAKDAYLFFTAATSSGEPDFGSIVEVRFTAFDTDWAPHPDESVDIAVVPFAPLIERLAGHGKKPFVKAVSTKHIPSAAELQTEFDAIEEIIFVGYPRGIYDTHNLLPVVRRGVTATPLAADYEGKPCFLIDASVFPGSSGSPVLLHQAGAYSMRGPARDGPPGIAIGSRFALLGVIAAVVTQTESGTLEFEEAPIALVPVVRFKQVIDLGLVIKAHTIIEAIECELRRRGELTT